MTPSLLLLDPVGWAAFRKLKVGGTNTNESLLGAGTTDAQAMLLSLPVIVNNAVPQSVGFVIDKNSIMSAVGQIKVATSEDFFFSADSVAVRATWRLGHAVVRPERIGLSPLVRTNHQPSVLFSPPGSDTRETIASGCDLANTFLAAT